MTRARATGAAFVVLIALSVLGVPARIGDPAPLLFELVLIALGAGLAVGAALRALGASRTFAPSLRVAIALLCAIALGQVARTKRTFPWMPYTMYGRAREGDVVFYRYTARRASGGTARFRPSLAIAALGNGRIAKGLHNRLEAIAALRAQGRSSATDERLLAQVLGELARREERERAAASVPPRVDPLVAIEVARMTLPPPYDLRALRSEPVATIPIERSP